MSLKNQNRIAFGYNRSILGKIEINKLQAQTVQLIFQLYADGKSMGKITEQFEACGIPSPYNKSKWGKQTLSKILSYERYLGDENYPQIIEKEQFDHVQTIKKSWAK